MNTRRSRGRGNPRGGRHPNFRNQQLDSNGPEGRIRGTANQIYDRYLVLARDAQGSGDAVLAENLLQHAEHYFRLMNINGTATQPQPNLGRPMGADEDGRDDGEGFDQGPERDEFQRDGFQREPAAAEGFQREGYQREGGQRPQHSRDGGQREGYQREGYQRDQRDGRPRDNQYRDGQNRDRDGGNRDGGGRDGGNRDGRPREGFQQRGGYQRDFQRGGQQRESYQQDGQHRDEYQQEGEFSGAGRRQEQGRQEQGRQDQGAPRRERHGGDQGSFSRRERNDQREGGNGSQEVLPRRFRDSAEGEQRPGRDPINALPSFLAPPPVSNGAGSRGPVNGNAIPEDIPARDVAPAAQDAPAAAPATEETGGEPSPARTRRRRSTAAPDGEAPAPRTRRRRAAADETGAAGGDSAADADGPGNTPS